MRFFLTLIVTATLFHYFPESSQKIAISIDKSVFVQLPEDINRDGLRIKYLITGAFGGYGSFIAIKPNVRNYEIPTLHKGKPVETLKLIVFSPHYLVKTFNFPTLEEQNKNIELKLESIGTVPFSGKVLLPNQLNPEELKVEVSYLATWECEYFQLQDCMLGYMPITSVNLEKDGKFRVHLPDFARDPTIASYTQKGSFTFKLGGKSSKPLFQLKDDSKASGEIQPALTYPTEEIFVMKPEK